MKPYKHADSTRGNEELYREAVSEMVTKLSGEVLVDLGSGSGHHSAILGRLMRASRVVCVDHDVGVFEKAPTDIEPLVHDLNTPLPLKEAVADGVLANQVIEHIVKTDVFAQETYRILKPGGKAVVCTPNLASWHNIGALMLGWQPFSMQVSDEYFIGNPKHPLHKSKIHETQAHLRVFTHRSLTELFLLHGFSDVQVMGVGYYPLKGLVAKKFGTWDQTHSAYILLLAVK